MLITSYYIILCYIILYYIIFYFIIFAFKHDFFMVIGTEKLIFF